MPTLLSNGNKVLIHAAPLWVFWTSGGAGKTIFSSGGRGGKNRAGR
jgi:hypothetical protein